MSLGNAVIEVAERIKEQLLLHPQRYIKRRWNLLQEELREECIRIARLLRGTLLQAFAGGPIELCLAGNWPGADSPAKPMLWRALDLMRKGLDEGRARLRGLRSTVLPEGSLEKALCGVRNDFTASKVAAFGIVIVGKPKSLDAELQQQILLIAREALLNALRHSGASSVEIEIEYLQRKLRVVVRDNGKGIDPRALSSSQRAHRGLTAMRENTISIAGEIRVWSKQGQGTEVEITVPMRGGKGRS